MTLLGELRTRARHIVGPFLAAAVFGYLAFHAVQGDRGLLAWLTLNQQVQDARMELARIDARRAELARRVRLLHPASLDRDLLEERVRATLGYIGKDDVVIGTGVGGRYVTGRTGGPRHAFADPAAGEAPPARGVAVRISLAQ